MLEHALDWASRGFKIFPLHPGTKRPVWKAFYEHATTDPERIKEIWNERDYNIGVSTDELIVVDVDIKDGKQGMSSLLELDINLETLTVRTPSGGLHLYFKNEGNPVANDAKGKLGSGIDVRSYHGFVVAPGSVFDGVAYRLDTDLPMRVFDRLLATRLSPPSERYTNGLDVELDDPAAVAHATEWLDHQSFPEPGARNDYLYRTACRLKDFGLSDALAFDLLHGWNDLFADTDEAAKLQTIVANAYVYGKSPPGAASPQHLFAGVEVEADRPVVTTRWFRHGDAWEGSVDWLYHELLPTTGVCILTAPSGAGKTFIALDFADSLARGRPFFGVSPEALGGTIMLIGEAYGSVKLRMAALDGLGGPLPISTTYVGGLAARGAWAALKTALAEEIAHIWAQHRVPVRLVILDTLSASGVLDDENDNAKAATVLKAFTELSVEMGFLFLILHHPPKSGEGERGAGAIRNNADYVMAIKRDGTSAVREIEMNKSRDGECKALGTFTLVPKFLKSDAKGRPIKTMIVSPGEPKIRESRAGSSHSGLAVECVEFALVSDGVQIEGDTWTEDEAAKTYFIERWDGKRDRVRITQAFKLAVDYALGLGSLEGMRQEGRTYLKLRKLDS